METFNKVVDLYVYDNLRADGMAVRFARLNMIDSKMTLVLALCWVMEFAFGVAFYSRGKVKNAAILAFWMAWLVILGNV